MITDIYFMGLYFFVYGFFGWCTEVAFAACKSHRFVNRGFLNGPFCPIYGFGVTIVIAFLTPYRSNILLLYLASVVLVSLLEGLTGWAMDKIFHNKWWDYSSMPLNIGGYVCLLFSLIWGVACVVIMNLIHPLIHSVLALLPQTLGIVLLVLLGILLLIDTCVTSSAIFKFNRQLEHMEKIAAELHELSDQLGGNIYTTTVRAMEAADDIQEKTRDTIDDLKDKTQDAVDEFKDRTQDAVGEFKDRTQDAMVDLQEKGQEAAENLRARFRELQQRYDELNQNTGRITRRLLRAFPKLESRKYTERVHEIRKQLLDKLHK